MKKKGAPLPAAFAGSGDFWIPTERTISKMNPESFVSGHGFIRAEKQRKNEPALAAALSEVKALGILTFFAASTTPNRVPHFRPLCRKWGFYDPDRPETSRSRRSPRASYQGTDLSVPKKQRKNDPALAAALSEVEALGVLTFSIQRSRLGTGAPLPAGSGSGAFTEPQPRN